MALKFKEKTKHRTRKPPKETLFARSKSKLAKKGKAKMTEVEGEPSVKQKKFHSKGKGGPAKAKKSSSKVNNLPTSKEVTMKKNTKEKQVDKNKRKQMQVFGRSHSAATMEFKGSTSFGAGMVSGMIKGSSSKGGLQGVKGMSRAGTRSLGNQPDGKNSDSPLETKGRRWARKREKGKVGNVSRKVDSKSNIVTGNKSRSVKSGRRMTNKVTEVVSRFKRRRSRK